MKKEATLTRRLRQDLQMRFHWGCFRGDEVGVELVQIRKRCVGIRESFPEESHIEHFNKAAVAVGLTGQLSIEVILVGDPASISMLSDGSVWLGILIAGDNLIGLVLLEREGTAIEMKERILRGEARIDSGDGRDVIFPEVSAGE